MAVNPYIFVLCGALLAAIGQVFFKLGAAGAVGLFDFINVRTISGLLLYGVSTVLWIFALSKLPLSRVYPFTVLTFLIVYAASILYLREPLTVPIACGAALVLVGLVIITTS